MTESTRPSKRIKPFTDRRAFTLVELVVVILIIGIVAAAAQPKYFESLSVFRVESAAQRIASDLRYAATHAQVTSRTTTVRFAKTSGINGYRFIGVADPYKPGATADPSDNSTWYTVLLSDEPYGVVLDSSALVTFDIYGMPNASGSVVVSANTQTRTIQWDAATGEVTVQ